MIPAQSTSVAAAVPPKILSGKEIYDAIMQGIEPELLSANIPVLEEKYKNETPAEWEIRKRRYNDAFAKFYEMYQAYLSDLDVRIHRYRKQAIKEVEAKTKIHEEHSLNTLAASMFS